jgi:hypothetical protein
MRGQLKFATPDPVATVPAYISGLTAAFYELLPADLEVIGSQVKVRGGVFRWVPTYNLLSSLTEVTVKAAPAPGEVVVTYDISVRETVVFCAAAIILVVPAMLYRGVPLFIVPLWPTLVWLVTYKFGNWKTERRMRKLFARVAEATTRALAAPQRSAEK